MKSARAIAGFGRAAGQGPVARYLAAMLVGGLLGGLLGGLQQAGSGKAALRASAFAQAEALAQHLAAASRDGMADLSVGLEPVAMASASGGRAAPLVLFGAAGILHPATGEALGLGSPAIGQAAARWLGEPGRGHGGLTELPGLEPAAPRLALASMAVAGSPLIAYAAVPILPAPPSLPLPIVPVLLGAALGGVVVLAASGLSRQRGLAADLAGLRRERDAAIEALAERQGLETLGRLTASAAHDMGNVIQALEFHLRAIPAVVDDRAELARVLDRARAAVRRGATGARDLLALARGNTGRVQPTEVAPLLRELADVMRELLGPGYQVELRIAPDLPPVLADPGDLEAMLVNLATNSRDAMLPTGGGLLRMAAAPCRARGPHDTEPGLPPGDWVRIEVADTGVGMDSETLARAMEPFFTTKSRGRGTGLGLALAREFAERSGGHLCIGSVPGQGTRVALYLRPAIEPKTDQHDAVTAASFPAPQPGVPGSTGMPGLVSRHAVG